MRFRTTHASLGLVDSGHARLARMPRRFFRAPRRHAIAGRRRSRGRGSFAVPSGNEGVLRKEILKPRFTSKPPRRSSRARSRSTPPRSPGTSPRDPSGRPTPTRVRSTCRASTRSRRTRRRIAWPRSRRASARSTSARPTAGSAARHLPGGEDAREAPWLAGHASGRSLRLDVCKLHDLAPLLKFCGDELDEPGRRYRKRAAA